MCVCKYIYLLLNKIVPITNKSFLHCRKTNRVLMINYKLIKRS